MANVERLRAVVEFIEEQQSRNTKFEFNMGSWIDVTAAPSDEPIRYSEWKCGTAACLAGSAALYTNLPIKFSQYGEAYGVISDDHEDVAAIEFWAQQYFELTNNEVDEIFYCSAATLDELKAHINWTLEEDVFPEYPWREYLSPVSSAEIS